MRFHLQPFAARHRPTATLCTGLALALLLPFTTRLAALTPVELRCEDQINPLAVDEPRPRLSWELADTRRGASQTAWQIQVASSPALLRRGTPDLWDSGRVESTEQNQIPYAGRPLTSHADCYWRVRVWDESGRASPWSQPARWTMGLLNPVDLRAKWIGAPPAKTHPLDGCRWIWHPEGDPLRHAPAGSATFRKTLILPPDARPVQATFLLAVNGPATIHVNGRRLTHLSRTDIVHFVDLLDRLQPGTNLISVTVENREPGPAGWTGRILLTLDQGTRLEIPVNRSWECQAAGAGASPANPDHAPPWVEALELGPFGMEPWGRSVQAQQPLPLFRREFTVRKPVQRALIHVCGLGQHLLYLDGRPVGDHFLDPPWTDYDKTLHYVTHDVTALLRPGRHALGVMLGKGFYNTLGDRRIHGVDTRHPLRLWLQAHLWYQDGSEEILITDDQWKTAPGPITHCAILGGEDFDARLEPVNWAKPGFDDRDWSAAVVLPPPGGRLRAAFAPPLREQETFRPVRVDEPEPGVFVFDFGQNASAIPRLRVRGAPGQILRLTPAEQRHGASPRRNDGRGRVNQAGVGRPNYWQYTLRGDWFETWQPRFTYSGFQYLEVVGAVPKGHPNPRGLPVIEELVSVHIRNDASRIGSFECSDPLLNQIDRIIERAVQANLSHVLTDCPHREKLGWLEVPYLMGPSIAGRYDLRTFYRKIARDCADAQQPDGRVPTVAPWYPRFSGPFDYTPEWGAAAVIIPWQLHQWYGDRAILSEQFETMRRFTDFLEHTSTNLVPMAGLGDWYDYGTETRGPSQFTPPELTAMATFYRCARTVADAARVLGQTRAAEHYTALSERIRHAFNQQWFNGRDEYRNSGSPQCAHGMALALGLVPESRTAAVLGRLLDDLRARNHQQTAGDVGFSYLLQALADHNRHDTILAIVSRTNLGSYGFIVRNGWTSLPEAWDAETGASMNHCMLGHIQQWFMEHLAGLRRDPAVPGGARWIIAPQPVGHLTWARAEHRSPRGWLRVRWERRAGQFQLDVEVPPNVTAEVALPETDPARVRESGKPASMAHGVRLLEPVAGRTRYEIGSGRYRFECPLTTANPDRP
jgi:hypothetical protein